MAADEKPITIRMRLGRKPIATTERCSVFDVLKDGRVEFQTLGTGCRVMKSGELVIRDGEIQTEDGLRGGDVHVPSDRWSSVQIHNSIGMK